MLSEITIPNGIVVIDATAFSSSGIRTVNFEENSLLVTVGYSAFEYCPIIEIDIPASVIAIGESAFHIFF